MPDSVAYPARRSWLRRLRVPLIAIAVPLAFFAVRKTLGALEGIVEPDQPLYPEAEMPLLTLLQFTTMLAILVVAVWFLFLSGFRPAIKLAGIVIVALLATALVGVTRRLEFGGKMEPIFVFRWDPDVRAELAKRLEEQEHKHTVSLETPDHLTAADVAIAEDDFPRYRGSAADGVAAPIKIADWAQRPPRELWRVPVGMSYAGIAVAGKVAVTLEQRDVQEAIVCYDRATGRERWAHKYVAEFKQTPPMGDGGPRSTPTIADGDVYSLGAQGDLVCLTATTGTPRWGINVVADNGATVAKWGMTSSPLIVGDLVVVNGGIDPDNNRHRAVAAYDRKSGKKVWAAGDHPAGYSSPMLADLGGRPQIVLFDGGGLAGIDPADGKELWRHPWKTTFDMNIIQPLILPGDRVFISSELVNGGALLQVKQSGSDWSVTPVWANRSLSARFANPVYRDGHIYGLSNGFLCCVDAATGKRAWKGVRFDSGQLLLSGDTLLVQTEQSGELVAAAADPSAYRELGRVNVFRGSRTWNTPALAGGRLYLRNHEEMVALDLRP